jgi:hypothetical protein
LANQYMRRELNDLVRRLDNQPAALELNEEKQLADLRPEDDIPDSV